MTDRTTSDSSSSLSDSERASRKKSEKVQLKPLREFISVEGNAVSAIGFRTGILVINKATKSSHVVPIDLTGRHNAAGLERWILQQGLEALLTEHKVGELGALFREHAGDKTVVVLDRPGVHRIEHRDSVSYAVAWNGRARWLGKAANYDIALVGEALRRQAAKGTSKSWLNAFEKVVRCNPRLLVLLCVSLSAAIRRPLREHPLTVGLVATTSTAKSTLQQVGSSMIGAPQVVPWNATNLGLQAWLADRPDQPVYVEDLHKADNFEDVAQVIMAVGNSAGRLTASRASSSLTSKVEAILLTSSEKSMAALAPKAATAGLLARYFEIHAGRHGMFDDLCGRPSGRGLANDLQRLAGENYGTVWPEWLKRLSKSWKKVERWHAKKLQEVRAAILELAGVVEPDELIERLADRLAFAAFSGCVATKLGLWEIDRKNVITAFALVLKEHVERFPARRNVMASAAIEEVRAYIETHHQKFLPIAQANDPNKPSGISGYVAKDKHGVIYLFVPGVFEKLFAHYGDEVYAALRAAGFLVTQRSRRNYYQKRVPSVSGGKRRSMDFVAVREDVRYSAPRP